MLYKLFLIGVVIFCSTGIGNVLLGERGKHISALKKLAEGSRILAEALETQVMTMPQALLAAEKATGAEVFSAMIRYLRKSPNKEMKEVAEASLAEITEMQLLTETEREIFGDFIRRVAVALTTAQIRDARAVFLQQMELNLEQLQQEQQNRTKIVKAMSLSIGLAIAVILV